MFERLFTPIGIKPADLTWRKNQFRAHLIDGIARRELARASAPTSMPWLASDLFLRRGEWNGQQILSANFIDQVRVPVGKFRDLPILKPGEYDGAPHHYGLLWWNNADGSIAGVPRHAWPKREKGVRFHTNRHTLKKT